jgi:hypothetical protein
MTFRAGVLFVVAASMVAIPAMASRNHRAPTSGHAHSFHRAAPKVKKTRGQQSIDPQRATAIQQALIREHYLNSEPTGRWDEETQAAMTKFQADQGWQTKLTPDSRALIKLGLGPDHSGAINASASAHFNTLAPVAPIEAQPQGLVEASGVKH